MWRYCAGDGVAILRENMGVTGRRSAALRGVLTTNGRRFLRGNFGSTSLHGVIGATKIAANTFCNCFSNGRTLFTTLIRRRTATVVGVFVSTRRSFRVLSRGSGTGRVNIRDEGDVSTVLSCICRRFSRFGLVVYGDRNAYCRGFIRGVIRVRMTRAFRFVGVLGGRNCSIPSVRGTIYRVVTDKVFANVFRLVRRSVGGRGTGGCTSTFLSFCVTN